MNTSLRIMIWALLAALCVASPAHAQADRQRIAQLETRFEALRERLRIPGLSAVVLRDQQVLWARGFGYADMENRVRATPDTVYPIASITKTFAAELVMQLVEQGRLDLDEPVSRYSPDFKDEAVRIKHLLSHTVGRGKPGEGYAYDPERYEHLTSIIEKATGKPFRQVMVETFLDPLEMSSTAPGPVALREPRYAKVLAGQAQPYTLYGDGEIVHTAYPIDFFGASAGLISTVLDLARYDVALDRHLLVKKQTQDRAWTNFVSNSGKRLPYGFGWFVEDYRGTKLIWHGGNWGTGFSAIYLKVPERNLTLIVLSNSEALNSHLYKVWNGYEEITHDAFACAFLRAFVFDREANLDCERISQAAMAAFLDERRARAREVARVDPSIYDAYVGGYQRPTRVLHVTKERGRLFMDYPRGFKSELFPESESTFFFKTENLRLTFIKNEQGEVTRIDFHIEGQAEPLTAPRVAAPHVDYHQHLVSPAFAPIAKVPMRDGAALVKELDAAGIERAVVLSVAYSFADERKKLADPDRLSREENDWTSAQVIAHAPRLVGFCSVNPLREAALAELDRCLRLPGMAGIKLHFGNAGVTLRNPAHLARIKEVFALAGRRGAPILVHMRARGGQDYGGEDARIFLEQLAPVAPGVDIIVAHFGGSGPGYDAQTDEVMAVFGAAAEGGDPRMRNLYFDVATIVAEGTTPADAALVVRRIRQLGTRRVLYGSDLSPPGGTIRAGWEIFRAKTPLAEADLRQVMSNKLSFMSSRSSM
jgi:CubicO group peptidase (beta-lactamase class C family)/predicted TIM-barrel fold metal-dependent hydrolase